MLTKIEVHSQWADEDPLILNVIDKPDTDLFEVRNIDGLESVKANVNTTPLGSVRGEAHSGDSVGLRNIVLTLGLIPDWVDWTYSKLRRFLDKYFVPPMSVRMIFYDDENSPVVISGYTESNAPSIFSKDPEHQISIICPEPDFVALYPTEVSGVTPSGTIEIDYKGTIETGLNLKVTHEVAESPVLDIKFGQPLPSDSTFEVGPISISDSFFFELNSVSRNKYVRIVEFLPSTDFLSVLNYVSPGYIWPVLVPGIQEFSIDADIVSEFAWVVSYYERFGSL